MKIYPNAKIEDIEKELMTELKKEDYISIQAEEEWEIKSYIKTE